MSFYRHANERIGTIENVYNGDMFQDVAINSFRNIERYFPTRTIPASSMPRPLEKSPLSLFPFKSKIKDNSTKLINQYYDLHDYFSLNSITGIVILKEGNLVYENYQHGYCIVTRCLSMSVDKYITSHILGITIKEYYIT